MTRRDSEPTHAEVLAANIAYHSALAETYDGTQPHYRPENVRRVQQILEALASQGIRRSLLDLGCGTGFIISMALRHFEHVVGLDATPQMLRRVPAAGKRVGVVLADSTALPFVDGTFDVCTAYGVLHHLRELGPTLREAFRCLRPGGVLYTDQDPNRRYWELMHQISREPLSASIVQREVESVLKIEDTLEKEFGLDAQTVALAEYQKIERKGFLDEDLVREIEEAGFRAVDLRYEWFLGEGVVGAQSGPERAKLIGDYLRGCLPATRHLFKYVRVIASKPLSGETRS